MSEKYKYCNHHHELTDGHEIVDFGDGEFVANKVAIPLLKSLAELGFKTRTHHLNEDGNGFFSISIEPHIEVSIRQIYEQHSTREKYNGMTEVIISKYEHN